MTTDPVCEMQVDERKAASSATYEGTTYYFCSESCKHEFDQDPRRYVGGVKPMDFSQRPNF